MALFDPIQNLIRRSKDLALRWGVDRDRLSRDLEKGAKLQRQLMEALNELPLGLVILDEEFRYVAWNKTYVDMYPNTADLIIAGEKLESAIRAGIERVTIPMPRGGRRSGLRTA